MAENQQAQQAEVWYPPIYACKVRVPLRWNRRDYRKGDVIYLKSKTHVKMLEDKVEPMGTKPMGEVT